ncbi:MAG: nuclear transport factor 2 family protein [Pseudomonadota bacterium]
MKPASENAGITSGRSELRAPRSVSSTPEGSAKDGAVRERVESLAQAIRDKDIDALMTHYAPDVVVFDIMPPLHVRGADAYRKNFERWFASMQGPINYEMHDLRISLSESHAFSFCLCHVMGTRKGGEKTDYWVRVTACLQQANGQWLVAHEHISMPATM